MQIISYVFAGLLVTLCITLGYTKPAADHSSDGYPEMDLEQISEPVTDMDLVPLAAPYSDSDLNTEELPENLPSVEDLPLNDEVDNPVETGEHESTFETAIDVALNDVQTDIISALTELKEEILSIWEDANEGNSGV